MELRKDDIYIGTERSRRTFVLGWQFGPVLMAVGCDLSEALEEFDERHGSPVAADPAALDDIGGVEAGLDCGELRLSSSKGPVFVDPYEFVLEFPSPSRAGAWWREF